jgi:hypothetical protein
MAAACACVVLASTALAGRIRGQTIVLSMGPNESGVLSLGASTFGNEIVSLDSSKLRLFARPYAEASNRAVTLAASIGKARDNAPSGPRGFATTAAGAFVPIADRSGWGATYPARVSWPDESGNDRVLEALRKKYVGHSVFGYGGIALSCRPQSTTFYSATTPVVMRSIVRERGTVTWLATGSAASAPYFLGLGFIAYDPLAIHVEEPDSALALGTSGGVGGSTKGCPAFELADWQIDTTLSLRAPPVGIATAQTPLRAGMSRDELVWARGYPNEVGTRATLRAESTWHYGASMARYTVTFRNDRVVSFTTPVMM